MNEQFPPDYHSQASFLCFCLCGTVQGTAADLIKYAMNKVHQALLDNKLETRMICQIHDELIFRVPKKEKETAYKLIKDIMENALFIDVPLEVDGGFGRDWYSAK